MAIAVAFDAPWMQRAACKGRLVTVELCHGCPVRGDCLAWAMSLPSYREIDEVAGGLTLDERNVLRRRQLRARPAPAEPDPDEPTKRCSYCHQTKPVSLFRRRATAKDGLDSHCKKCSNAIGNRTRKRRMHAAKEIPAELTCLRCKETKAGAEFNADRSRVNGRRTWCKTCDRAYSRQRRAERVAQEREGA